MAVTLTVSDRILEVMRRTPECRLDDLVLACQEFPWQAVLFEVNRLSREGRLNLTLISARAFAVRLVERESPVKVCEGSSPVRGGWRVRLGFHHVPFPGRSEMEDRAGRFDERETLSRGGR